MSRGRGARAADVPVAAKKWRAVVSKLLEPTVALGHIRSAAVCAVW